MRTLLLGLLCVAGLAQTALERAVQENSTLTAEQAASLERELAANPFLMEARARLIGHYFRQVQQLRQDVPAELRQARGRHVRWFIEHQPSSEVLATGEAFAMSGWMHDPDNYRMTSELWHEALRQSPDNVQVLQNATYLLQQHDRPLAARLMRRAYRIAPPGDAAVAGYYGTQLGLLWLDMGRDGGAARTSVETEIDASRDARVLGSAGGTIAQYANGEGEGPAYARRLLEAALSLAPSDRAARNWQRSLQRLSGAPAQLTVPGERQLEKITHRVAPEYPSAARSAGVTGTVLVNAVIAPDGTVAHTIAISGPKELLSAAAAAVKQWRFQPTLVGGRPVEVASSFIVAFAAVE